MAVLSHALVLLATTLIVNADNDHYFRQRGAEKMTREAMVAYLDDVAQGGKVTDFVMCTMGQRASYDSKVCEPIWLGVGEQGADRWVSNAKLCHERGLDVYKIWIDRCREKGIVPWISMRMNDVHGVTGQGWFRTCGFWRDHPELRRHPELDPLKGGGGWLNFTLDYAHKEVRDYHLAIFRELVDRYDADGYELDWMRWPCCFRPGHEKEDAHFITEFMRTCRAVANAAAEKRGHPVRLCVRVPQKLVCAEGFGLDPVRWAKEGLVDLIVPTCFIQAYDYELNFAGWAKAIAAVNPKVEVIPGGANMFSASDYGGTVPFELAAWRGWCDNMFVQGAKGVYLFNADYLEPEIRSEVYAKGVDPAQAANLPRRLLSSFDDITSVEGTLGQRCPFHSREGKEIVISGGTAETVREVAVVLAMSEKGEPPRVELNGQKPQAAAVRLGDCAPYCAKLAKDAWRWSFPKAAFRSGPNVVKVFPNAAATPSNAVVWCEIALGSGKASSAETELLGKLPAVFAKAAAHYKALDAAATPLRKGKMSARQGRQNSDLYTPHGFNRKTGKLDMRSIYWWTAGHYPGSLWYLYEATGDEFFKARATDWTEILAPNAKVDDNHDVGFIMYCSFGNARRILRTDKYDKLLVEAAESLARRYNARLGLIRSWGAITNRNEFLVIPDNLMNLELLEAASKLGGKRRLAEIARRHADVTREHHFRADGGCYHVLDYDQGTGRVKGVDRGQGKSCKTAWGRGQSWAIYGYTMMYRMTGLRRDLDFAKKLADFAMNHPNMPADGIPYWDYGAPGEERDTSAGAIMASALLELSRYAGKADGARYRAFAVKQLAALTSPAYFSDGEEIGHFLLKHGVGHKPAKSEIDTPLDYGDYYFLEALLRFRALAAGGDLVCALAN